MFEVMAEIEAMCGFRAARHITSQQIADINLTLEACERAIRQGDSDEYYRENEKFHHLIYEASSNRFLAREAARLHKRLKPYRRMQLRVTGRMPQSMKEHRAIFAALQRSDSKATATALRLHVAIQGEKFSDLMASFQQLVPVTARMNGLQIFPVSETRSRRRQVQRDRRAPPTRCKLPRGSRSTSKISKKSCVI